MDWRTGHVRKMDFDLYKNSNIIDTHLIWFQYRIIHRIIGTQQYLFKIKISTFNLAMFLIIKHHIIVLNFVLFVLFTVDLAILYFRWNLDHQ